MDAHNFTDRNMWLEELDTFKAWKKKRARRYLFVAVLIVVLEVIIFGGQLILVPHFLQSKDIIESIAGMILFLTLAFYCLYQWGASYKLKPKDVSKAVIVEKSRFSKRKTKRSENCAYYLTAVIGKEKIEALCDVETYRTVQSGDTVIFFRANSAQYYAVRF